MVALKGGGVFLQARYPYRAIYGRKARRRFRVSGLESTWPKPKEEARMACRFEHLSQNTCPHLPEGLGMRDHTELCSSLTELCSNLIKLCGNLTELCSNVRCGSSTCRRTRARTCRAALDAYVQGHLAHKKLPTPLGLPYGPRHGPAVGS